MDKTGAVNAMPQHDKDYQAAVDRCLIEIEQSRGEMAQSQHRIERLRAETQTMLAETRQVLAALTA